MKEYTIFEKSVQGIGGYADALNEIARDGWEIVQVLDSQKVDDAPDSHITRWRWDIKVLVARNHVTVSGDISGVKDALEGLAEASTYYMDGMHNLLQEYDGLKYPQILSRLVEAIVAISENMRNLEAIHAIVRATLEDKSGEKT